MFLGFHYFCFPKKIRRVTGGVDYISERAGGGYPYPRQPQGNYPGAQLCNFDCCLRRLGRLGLAIFRQSLGICSTARFGSSGHDRQVRVMPALPPRPDIVATQTDVCFVPKADIANLIRFDPLRAQTVDVKMVSRSSSSFSIIFALCATASLNKSRIETTAITLPLSTTGR